MRILLDTYIFPWSISPDPQLMDRYSSPGPGKPRALNSLRRLPLRKKHRQVSDDDKPPFIKDAVTHGEGADESEPDLSWLPRQLGQRLAELRIQTQPPVKFLQRRQVCLAIATLAGDIRQGEQAQPHLFRIRHAIRRGVGRVDAHWGRIALRVRQGSLPAPALRWPRFRAAHARNSPSSKVWRTHSSISGGIRSGGKDSGGGDGSGLIGCSLAEDRLLLRRAVEPWKVVMPPPVCSGDWVQRPTLDVTRPSDRSPRCRGRWRRRGSGHRRAKSLASACCTTGTPSGPNSRGTRMLHQGSLPDSW